VTFDAALIQGRLGDPERLAALARLKLVGTPREESFDRLARLATRLLGAPGALVNLVTDEAQFCKSSVGLPEPWASEGLPLSYGLCPYTVASGEPLVVDDARVDPRFCENAGVRELGIAGYAGVPLLVSDGHAVGALCAFDGRTRSWTADDLQTLQDLAAAVMTEIELRVASEAALERERQLREERETLETINHVGRLLTAEFDIATLVQAVTDAATTLTAAQFGAFFYNALDERGEYYTLYAIAGVPREAFARFPLPRNSGLFGPTFRGEGIVRLANVRLDPRFGQNPPYYGMPPGHLPVVSYLAVPVIGRSGEVLGGLFFGHAEPGVFTERAEQLVVGLAAQAAVAIENARLYQQAQQEIEERRRAETEKQAFVDAVAHDLQNPLGAAKAQAQLLARRVRRGVADAETIGAGLTAIDGAVSRASRLITELLDVAHMEADRPLDLHRTPTDLVALARDCVADAEAASPQHVIRLEAETAEVVGIWDAARLGRVLANLLSNAVKYSPPTSEVVVRVGRVDGEEGAVALLAVVDRGVGIPAADLPRIFNRFHRGGNVAGRFAGTGIGLWGAQRIAAAHGGTIAIDSREGAGTTVTVRLPLAPTEVQSETED
jgi:signal transduction histidine kinase